MKTSRHAPSETGLAARFKAMNPKVRIGIIGGTVVVLLLLIIGIASRPPPPPPVDMRAQEGASRMQEARNAVKDGRYEDAAKLVDEAEKLSPGIDKTKLGLQAREALAISRSFDQVKKLIGDKRFEDAKKVLSETPKGNNKMEDQRDRLQDELDAALIEYHKAKVLEFLAAGELESAKQMLAQIPGDQLGDLPSQVTEFERTLEESAQADEKDKRAAAANAAAAKRAQREEQMALAFAIVQRQLPRAVSGSVPAASVPVSSTRSRATARSFSAPSRSAPPFPTSARTTTRACGSTNRAS